jgi:hypothetical protein
VDRRVEISGRFDGKNITKFLATYRNGMQQRDMHDRSEIASFKWVVEPQVRERIIEIKNAQPTWTGVRECASRGIYVGRRIKNDSTCVDQLDREERQKFECFGVFAEFDRMYDRHPGADQQLLDGDKVILFLKAVEAKDRCELGNLLEEETQLNGLVADWTTVKKACNRLDKHRQWLEDADAKMAQPKSWK